MKPSRRAFLQAAALGVTGSTGVGPIIADAAEEPNIAVSTELTKAVTALRTKTGLKIQRIETFNRRHNRQPRSPADG